MMMSRKSLLALHNASLPSPRTPTAENPPPGKRLGVWICLQLTMASTELPSAVTGKACRLSAAYNDKEIRFPEDYDSETAGTFK